MSSDPLYIEHIRRTATPFGMRVKQDGDALDLTGLTVRAGLEKNGATGTNSASFQSWVCTAHGTAGTVSGTIPHTGINFTGDATLRIWASGSPRQFLGRAHAVKVRELSDNWIS